MLAKGAGKPLLLSSLPLVVVFFLYLFFNSDILLYSLSIFSPPILFTLYFFRDPEREINKGITSPADGKVQTLDKEQNTIQIFMNVWDVHVNRAPWKGRVKAEKYRDGSHLPAFSEAAEKNERRVLLLDTEYSKIKVWQISGLIGRRIVPYVEKNDEVEKGEKIGMIRFGSKVKLEFSNRVDFSVEEGQRVKAGETTLGVWDAETDSSSDGDEQEMNGNAR
ncbi:MAG: phosphatidylserine decarboxylase [Candidatus Thermoplasmatota archaeon]